MTKNERILAKIALQVLDSAGPSGLSREAFLTQVEVMAEKPLSTSDGTDLIALLLEKNWVYRFVDPITEIPRYMLSGTGKIAKGAL